jgi:hypothetical protein
MFIFDILTAVVGYTTARFLFTGLDEPAAFENCSLMLSGTGLFRPCWPNLKCAVA